MKNYRLMKVTDGKYNIRDKGSDQMIGHLILDQDGGWSANVKGHSAVLKTKDKALGFIRGVTVASGVPTVHVSYNPLSSEGSSGFQADAVDSPTAITSQGDMDKVIYAIEGLKDALDNFSASI